MTTLPEVPFAVRRKSIKAPTKLSWSEQEDYLRAHAHEVWRNARADWTWYLIKDYQADRTKEFARGFFLVDGFESELGDTYWADVTEHGRRIR